MATRIDPKARAIRPELAASGAFVRICPGGLAIGLPQLRSDHGE
jgi:hypothetical protein